jgi:hypothetical protein
VVPKVKEEVIVIKDKAPKIKPRGRPRQVTTGIFIDGQMYALKESSLPKDWKKLKSNSNM